MTQLTVSTCRSQNWLDPYLSSFEEMLIGKKYSAATIKPYLVLVRRLARIMDADGIAPEALTTELAAYLVRDEERHCKRRNKCKNIAKRFAEHLMELGVVPAPVPTAQQIVRREFRISYENYLDRQRGLSPRTIGHAWGFANRFFDFRFGTNDIDLAVLTPDDIISFLHNLLTAKPPYRDKTPSTHLRCLFQYLFKTGATKVNLALCVPSVAQRWDARLPRYLSPDQIEAILGSVRAKPKNGARDYAMILLMARLGLRAPEVIVIQLDDIDWRAGELLVRGKGKRHDRLPLPHDVGEALAAYIRHERVSTSRTLFVKRRAPNGPFECGEVANNILKGAFAATGIKPPSPYVGSHVLRHSLATSMVRKGASLAEVGDVLRHRSRTSTMIYAKMDLDGLRSIAQAWPLAGDVQ